MITLDVTSEVTLGTTGDVILDVMVDTVLSFVLDDLITDVESTSDNCTVEKNRDDGVTLTDE